MKINEIGDTQLGQEMLGRLSSRKIGSGDRKGNDQVFDYAANRRKEQDPMNRMSLINAYERGYNRQYERDSIKNLMPVMDNVLHSIKSGIMDIYDVLGPFHDEEWFKSLKNTRDEMEKFLNDNGYESAF